MGREFQSLIAPALLDADAVMRSRALKLYQMCVSAGWESARKRDAAKEHRIETKRQQEVFVLSSHLLALLF